MIEMSDWLIALGVSQTRGDRESQRGQLQISYFLEHLKNEYLIEYVLSL